MSKLDFLQGTSLTYSYRLLEDEEKIENYKKNKFNILENNLYLL